LIILLILMAAPLLGGLTTNTSIAGLTSIWIGLIGLLVVAVVISVVRLVVRGHRGTRDKAA
jgi:hypothetical protein